jgi:hypothetical protein
MAGSFQVVTMPLESRAPTGIAFRQIQGVTATKEDSVFAARVVARLKSVKRMLNHDAKFAEQQPFRDIFLDLLGIAKSAVERPDGDLMLGEVGLKDFEDNTLIDLGKSSRNRFFRIQGLYCLIALSLGALAIYLSPFANSYEHGADKFVQAFGFDLIGISIAVLLAGLWRNKTITWENIDYLDPDGYPPPIRILGVVLLSVVLMVILYKKVLILGVGSIELNNFVTSLDDGTINLSRASAMILGFLCGLSEVPVVKIVQKYFDTARPRE